MYAIRNFKILYVYLQIENISDISLDPDKAQQYHTNSSPNPFQSTTTVAPILPFCLIWVAINNMEVGLAWISLNRGGSS